MKVYLNFSVKMDGLIAIQVTLQSIASGDNESLEKYLAAMQIYSLPMDKERSLRNRLLTTAWEFGNGGAVKVIILYFEPNYKDNYQLPILNSLLVDMGLNWEVVAFVLKQFPEYSYFELAVNFIKYDSSPVIIPGLNRLEDILGPLKVEEYRLLYDQARAEANFKVADFFSYQLDTKGEYAEIPSWVKNFEEELPALPEFIFTIPTEDETVTILTSGMRAAGKSRVEVEDARADLRKKLIVSTLNERRKLLETTFENQYRLSLASNESLFRIYGPVNPILGDNLTGKGENEFGGARMFTNITFEDFLEPGQDVVFPLEEYSPQAWFTGACQQCHRKIRKYTHAIRIPLDHGGWKGCFCDPQCIREYLEYQDAPASFALLDETVKQLNEIGIQE